MKNQRPVKKSIKKASKRPGLGQQPKRFRRESRKPNPKIMVQRSPLHGLGVWAQAPIKEGEFLVEYVGQLLTAKQNEALQSHTDDPNHTFSFGLSNGLIIDGGVQGNISRYINHSCDPNAEFVETDDNKLFVYAKRDLAAGEEIFFDYSLQYDGPHTQEVKDMYKCMCGAATCRGTMIDLNYKPALSPRERVDLLEDKVEQLTRIATSQAELIANLTTQLLELTRQYVQGRHAPDVEAPKSDSQVADGLMAQIVQSLPAPEIDAAPKLTFAPKPKARSIA